jgi:DNA-binding transcriptional LysR family regulator
VPYHVVAKDIETGRLVRLLPDFERVEGAVFILYPAQRTLALKTRAFIDFFGRRAGSDPTMNVGICRPRQYRDRADRRRIR